MSLINILFGIIVLFFLILVVRIFLPRKVKGKICSICLASSLTWISLLVLYYLGKFDDVLIIALLMGMTLLGVFYIWERNVKKSLTFFRLPFLLSLIIAGYYVLTLKNVFREIVLLIVLWLIFGVIYFYRANLGFKKFVDKVVECCKKW